MGEKNQLKDKPYRMAGGAVLLFASVLAFSILMASCGKEGPGESASGNEEKGKVRPLIAKGLKLLDEKNYEQATIAIHEILDKDPNDTEAMSVLAMIFVNQFRLKDAKEWAEKALEIDATLAVPYAVLGKAKFLTSYFDDAMELSRKALIIDPNNSLAYEVIGQIYLRRGRVDDGLSVLKEAVRLHPDNPELLNILSSAYIKAKDYDRALAVLLKAQKLDKDIAGVHFNLARVYTETNAASKAFQHINRAENLYAEQENRLWLSKARELKRHIAKKFKMRPQDLVP